MIGITSAASWHRKLRNYVKIRLSRWYENLLLQHGKALWVCSDEDRNYLGPMGYRADIRVMPNFSPVAPIVHSNEQRNNNHTILFVGTIGYHANRTGMSWFLKQCWQHIRQQVPQARCLVVGKWPDWEKPGPEYNQPGVEVVGFVDDLEAVWHDATLMVCPLLVGGGTRIKILEAWPWGMPVVTTTVGIEGIAHIPGFHALVADALLQFAQYVVDLLNDPDKRSTLGQAGQQICQTLYSQEVFTSLVSSHASQVIQSSLEHLSKHS